MLRQCNPSIQSKLHAHKYEWSHYTKYTDDLLAIGFEPEKTILEGGKAKYAIEIIEASPSGFIAKAKAVVDFDQDGMFNEWEISNKGDLREIVQD